MKDMEANRDKKFDELLRATMTRQSTTAAGSECLDAETAAAWADGALSADELARVEKHAAACARCQALVAALVTTAPPAPARVSWFRFSRAAWLAPLTAAAAAVIFWMVLPVSKSPSRAGGGAPAELTLADSRDAAQGGKVAPQSPQSATAPEAAAPLGGAALADKDEAGMRTRAQRATPVEELKKERRLDEASDSKLKAANEVAGNLAAAPPPAPPGTVQETVTVAGSSPVVEVAPPPQQQLSPSQQQSVAETARLRESVAVDSLAAKSAPTRREQTPAIILSPNANQRWRLGGNLESTIIEYSSDGGRSWAQQPVEAGTHVTAGASPAPNVCWLVGRAGTVLLTTDGKTWHRFVVPAAVDLVSVQATDDRNATVTAADGRAFSTSDRGVTWTNVSRD
jgi:Putative zinc-finger/Photosynthesis system II assembly factor YCF48